MPSGSVSIQGIEFEIKGSASGAAKSLDNLSKTLTDLKNVVGGNSGLSTIAKDLKSFAQAVESISTGNIKAMVSDLKKMEGASSGLAETTNFLKQIAAIDFFNLAEAAQSIGLIGKTAGAIGRSGGGKKSDATVAESMGGSTTGTTTSVAAAAERELADATRESGDATESALAKYRETEATLGKLSATAKNTSKKFLTLAKNIAIAPFQPYVNGLKNVASKLGTVGAALKRILFYRVIRTIIKEIGAAFRTGIGNLYGWSQMADGRFAASMDRMATAMLYFKNSIGAAVAPLLNALAPALDYLIDKIVAFLNVVNQLFAKLTGASYWTKANKVATQYADNASAAGGAAKEALRYLAPFDELNVLPSDKGGGGGGGASGTDYSGMFETQEAFNQEIADFAEMIKNAWGSNDWQEVGTFLGDKINELIEQIPWAELGTNVGKFINGLFGTQYWTLETINFTNLGSKIAEFVNNAVANIDFDIAGRLPVRKLTAIIDTIIGFLQGLDWGQIGRAVSDFLKGSLSEGIEWMEGTDFTQLGRDLYKAIRDFIANVDWAGLATDVNKFLGEAIKAAIGILLGIVDGLFGDVVDAMFGDNTWVKVKNWFIEGWNSVIDYAKQNSFIVSIADFLGFNLDDLKLDPIEIPVTGSIEDAKDSLTEKPVVKTKALFNDWDRSSQWKNGGDYWNSIGMKSLFNDWSKSSQWKNGGDYWNGISMKSLFYTWKKSSSFNSNLSMTAYLTKVNGQNMIKLTERGGAFFGGKWHNIPQYANGTPNAGSIFVAGEAGPEIVGHINGRTEVLNASQIASAIAAGVSSYSAPEETGDTEEMLYRAFIRALTDASSDGGDIYLDGEKIYQSVVRHNTQNTRMTGINQLARA